MRRRVVGPVLAGALAAGLLGFAVPAHAGGGQTFTVTDASLCGGAGTFEQAVLDANASPGQDVIAFTAGLVVDVQTCAVAHPGADQFPIVATEAVDIVGNKAQVMGNQFWLDPGGNVNNAAACPVSANGVWMSPSTGFLGVGTAGQDNSSVTVSVAGLSFDNLPTLFAVNDNASLTLADSAAEDTNSFNGQCNTPAIAAGPDANVTLRDAAISHSHAVGIPTGQSDFAGLITGRGGDLVLERVFFDGNAQGRAVAWADGQSAPASVRIVSSKLAESGGLWLDATNSDIVNTAFFTDQSTPAARVVSAAGSTTVEASTFYWGQPVCVGDCGVNGMGFRTAGTGTFAFSSSAIGANAAFRNSGPLLFGDASKFSSDDLTWVQQTANQSNARLQMILPFVMTGTPGLTPNGQGGSWIEFVTPLLGTGQSPGVLVDAVADASCPNGSKALINPIDSTCIATDVFGNPRVDAGNGMRSIGAVQTSQSPYLALDPDKPITANSVSLMWNRPADPVSGPITDYYVYYTPASGGSVTAYYVSGPNTLSATIPGLTEGTAYRFRVVGLNQQGPGTHSNDVIATPQGAVAPATAVTQPGNRQVRVVVPDANGGGSPPPVKNFVQYRKKGDSTWVSGPPVNARTATVAGLDNRVDYEFSVVSVNQDQSYTSPVAVTTATPRGDMFIPIDPARAYDSRVTGGALPDDSSRTVSVAGQVPDKATAVAYNVTVTDMTGPGYLAVTPGDAQSPPVSSTINWDGPGETIANGMAVGVDAQRQIKVFSGKTGAPTSTQFVIDVVGYFMPAAESPDGNVFVPVDPVRAYDSRDAQGILISGQSRTVDLAAQTNGALPDGVTAVAYNLTATDGVNRGYLTVTPASVTTAPQTSTINWWGPGQVISNGIGVKVDQAKKVNVFAGGQGGSQFVIDIVGYFVPTALAPDGNGFTPITPTRTYDSRTHDGPIHGSQERTVSMASGGLVPVGANGVVYNITLTGTVASRYLTVTPATVSTPPISSTINWWQSGQILSNGMAVGIDANRNVNVFAGPAGNGARTDFVIDVVGYYN